MKIKDAVNIPNLLLRGKWYFADFRDPTGNRIRRALKTKDRAIALQLLRKMTTEAFEKGHYELNRPTKTRFSELADRVLEYMKDKKRCYKKVYVPMMKPMKEVFGNRFLFEITPNLVEQYVKAKKDEISESYANRAIRVLKRAFNLAIQWELTKSNPVNGVEFYKQPKGRIRFLALDEIKRLINSCSGYLREIVLTALHTGGRKSEILGLKWENIDFENKLVVFERTKNDDVRQIPMTEELYRMLANMRAENPKSEYLFAGKDGKPFGKVDKSYKTALRSAGIENFRFHDLRHTYASQLVMSGVDILTIKELLGHKDLKTTLIYAHLAPKHKQEAIKVYEKHLNKVIGLVYGHNLDTNGVVAKVV